MAFELPILFLNVLNIFFAQRCPERMFVSFLWSPAQIHPKIYAEIFGYRMKIFFVSMDGNMRIFILNKPHFLWPGLERGFGTRLITSGMAPANKMGQAAPTWRIIPFNK